MVEWRENGADLTGFRRQWESFASHAPTASDDATEHCGTRNAKCVTPPSEEAGEPRMFSMQRAARLLHSSSWLIGMSTVGETGGFCHATYNDQEGAPQRSCCHEYGLGLNEDPTLKSTANYPLVGKWMPKQRCTAAAVMRIGGVSMEDPTLRNIANCLPTREWKQQQRNAAEGYHTFPATEVQALQNTENHTLSMQVGMQETIIMESVMLIMEQHQSTSTRPVAPRHTAEHQIHTTRRRREPAKQQHRERNLEEEKGAEPGKKDK